MRKDQEFQEFTSKVARKRLTAIRWLPQQLDCTRNLGIPLDNELPVLAAHQRHCPNSAFPFVYLVSLFIPSFLSLGSVLTSVVSFFFGSARRAGVNRAFWFAFSSLEFLRLAFRMSRPPQKPFPITSRKIEKALTPLILKKYYENLAQVFPVNLNNVHSLGAPPPRFRKTITP